MTDRGKIAKIVLALFPFSLWPPKREGEKEQRLWLFASLLSDLQTAGRSACEDGWLQALL